MWSLLVDDFQLMSWKGIVPEFVLCLFQESDNRQHTVPSDDADDPEEITFREYAARPNAVRDRLDVLGVTAAFAERSFEEGLAEAIRECEACEYPVIYAERLKVLREHSYARWKAALRTMTRRGIDCYADPSHAKDDPIIREILAGDDYSYLFMGSDLAMVRAYLDAVPEAREVVLDCSAILFAGYYPAEDYPICAEARRASLTKRSILAPTVILTEGSTDTRYLREALTTLYPHLTDYYTFFDFDARTGGGNDTLTKMVRAFVGAGMPMQMVVLFDNDAAGHAALKSLEGLVLPSNFRVMPYPDTDLAGSYPTVGPQGRHIVDVNGQACSIEMYLGREALTGSDGLLRPVEWTSRDARLARYQGKVSGKAEVGEAFIRRLRTFATPKAARDALPEMCALWQAIFWAFNEGQARADMQTRPAAY